MRDHRETPATSSTHRFADHETFVRRPKTTKAREKAKASKIARRKNRSSK